MIDVFIVLLTTTTLSSVCCFFLMIRRPPRSTLDRSSAASDVYKRQALFRTIQSLWPIFYKGQGYRSDLDENELDQPRPCGEGTKRLTIYETVSYTHLRAHETVLDLVCRLLLEKKTTNKTTTHTHNTHTHTKPRSQNS